MELEREEILRAVLGALEEDLGREGDVTSTGVIAEEATASAAIVAGSQGVLAGVAVAKEVFSRVGCRMRPQAKDGDPLEAGMPVARVGGGLRSILAAERTALNFLARLSGIATAAARYVAAVDGTGVRIRDTRKTTPGLRVLEKYAASVGGCETYRVGLFHGMFLKDNHVRALGGASEAVRRAREARPDLQVLVEVETPEDAAAAAEAGADEILLDNMTPEALREAVRQVDGRSQLEASGGVTLETVRTVAETGVDSISVGAITHAAPWLDFSLDLEEDA